MWVLRKYPSWYTVGYYQPDGTFYEHGTYDSAEEAELKVAFLNGGVLHIALEECLRDIAQSVEFIAGSTRGRVL